MSEKEIVRLKKDRDKREGLTVRSGAEKNYVRVTSNPDLILSCSTLFECEALLHIPVTVLQDYKVAGFVLVCSDCRAIAEIDLDLDI